MAKLVEFSERVTAKYDQMFNQRRGANLVIIGKPEYAGGRWLRKRLTWEMGPMYSDTLEEAMALMERL